jgi:N-acetylmuramoyl-L-alanine amidase
MTENGFTLLHKGAKAPIRIVGYFGVIGSSMYYMLRLKREICGAIFVFMMVLWGANVSAAVAVVTDVRVGQHSQSTRFVLELDRQVKFSVFMLAKPYRVVIDLPEVGWRLPSRPLPFNRGLVKQFRYGLFQPGTSRVVLDVKGSAAVKQAFILEPKGGSGYRLVVDLASVSPQVFMTQVKRRPLAVNGLGNNQSQRSNNLPNLGILSPPSSATAPILNSRSPAAQARVTSIPQPIQKSKKKPLIVLDPGHGGVDPGTHGRSGIYEKHITLSAAREFKAILEKTGRYRVVLTRNRDIFIRLRDRITIARDAGADLFISIHADAIKNRKVRGLSVYTLSETASDKEAAGLAEKENKSDLIAGIDLSDKTPEVANILIDLTQRESMNQSARFATGLVKELARKTKLLRNTHRFAGFVVLKAPDVPSVLIELGFLSNRLDEQALVRKSYRAKLGKAIAEAVNNYFTRIEEAIRK